MKLFSSAFREGEAIPPKYTCDGENVSPPLEWADVPANAAALALIVDDPDAPRGVFVHWVLFDVPATEHGLTEGTGIAGAEAGGGRQGRNGFGKLGYGGPCPPGGTHRYYFRLYAFERKLGLRSGVGRDDVDRAISSGRVLAEAQLMGRYTRGATSPR
ncbi:MAG TPA: YbhB/YbcL family Raf kinase inhibitor-like protein [Bryobacteraceae bacterium]|nr:YbhB/YbcL family Raf kinase inhibitor-like protein [Bryobacteraceae bacterium]